MALYLAVYLACGELREANGWRRPCPDGMALYLGCVQHSMDVFSTPWGLSVLCGVSVRWLAAVPLGAPGSWRGGQQESPPPHTYLGTLVRLYD